MKTTHQQVPRIQLHLRKRPPRRTPQQNRQREAPFSQSNKIGGNIGNIYLDSDEVLLTKLTKIADTVNPVNPVDPVTEVDNWKKRMFNSYKRLNMAYRLNQWPKKDDQDKATQVTGMDTIQEDDQSTQIFNW